MFIRKEGVKEVKEEKDIDDVGNSTDTTRESKFTLLAEDLEFSKTSEDKDGENIDDVRNNDNENIDSDTFTDEDHRETNAIKINNNNDDLFITISSDLEDEGKETFSSCWSTNIQKKLNTKTSTVSLKCFYEHYKGTVEKRKIHCRLCLGSNILQYKSFPKHIKNVHERHEKQKCEICHKDFAYILQSTEGLARRKLLGIKWN